MTYEKPSSLAFSIKESVWLNRGNEIEELLSLALEPDISIREVDDQVYIRGSLQLQGEYRPKEERDYTRDSSSEVSFRSVEEVSMTDDGVQLIRHSFPLDVTIPRDRIENLEDLYVTVDTFDYELPDNGCIELEASVSVSGIKSERNEPYEEFEDSSSSSEEEEYSYVPPNSYENIEHKDFSRNAEFEEKSEDRSFHFESVRKAPEIEDEEVDDFSMKKEEEFETYERNDHELEANTVEEVVEVNEEDEPEIVDEPSIEEEVLEEPMVRAEETPEVVEPPKEPTIRFSSNKANSSVETSAESNQGEDNNEERPEVGEKKEENALYLTKMLTKGEEEFSKLRMCIVQEGESLETIADRYDLELSQIIRMNRLNDERVGEGQILYIPVKKTPTSKS
ncbi:stage VI sporulation protein D [Evansella sp. AB-rgal1]|uniref:stage VI sporulation protein D n=1 Tax=Evansella sp. AB-rgal1 TaxID=3242696 RepID=UPI00359DE42A